MSTDTNPLDEISSQPVTNRSPAIHSIALFTSRVRILWVIVSLLTVAPELLPIRPMPLLSFCIYYLLKVIFFISLGFLAPLAFRSLNGIGLGLLLSSLSAFVIEMLQGLLHNGHVFHWYELAGKLTLIALGFALALDCRYELKIPIGPLKLELHTDIP